MTYNVFGRTLNLTQSINQLTGDSTHPKVPAGMDANNFAPFKME